MMNRLVFVLGVAVGLGAGAGELSAQTEEYRNPACELDQGHFLVKSATTYLKAATEDADPANRDQLLTDAHRNLVEAIQTDQVDNPSVWYFLGRYYVLQNDGIGADSAFSRVEQTVPECQPDIDYYRQTLYVRAVNRGIDSLQNFANDGAKLEFRNAGAVWPTSNVPPFYLASVFGEEGEIDSSLYYFGRVTEIGMADTAHLDNYNTSVENMAILYQMIEEHDSTIAWFKILREIDPSNNEALLGIAEAYTYLGDTENAGLFFDSVLANAQSMSDLDLMNAGVKLFNSDEFDRALAAFEAGLAKNPFHRDGLYNLSNTYLAVYDDASRPQSERDEALRKMDETTHRLVEVDPQNREAYRILAAAHQMQGMDDSTAAVMDVIDSFAYEISIDLARPESGMYLVAGRVVNLRESQTTFPEITFEFLDATGNVVATDAVAGAALDASSSTRFDFRPTEPGILAWRYRVGS
jgi:tetratricopeptide (TPR) repeat protein